MSHKIVKIVAQKMNSRHLEEDFMGKSQNFKAYLSVDRMGNHTNSREILFQTVSTTTKRVYQIQLLN